MTTNILQNLLLKNMNKSNICSMNISSLIFESLDMKVKAFMIPTNTIEGNIYKKIYLKGYMIIIIYNHN